MYVELYVSGSEISIEDVASILLDRGILCNVFAMESVVYDKATQPYRREPGVRVNVFDIHPRNLLSLWDSLRFSLGIHCIYIEAEDYSGCITEWQYYTDRCQAYNVVQLNCSEYS